MVAVVSKKPQIVREREMGVEGVEGAEVDLHEITTLRKGTENRKQRRESWTI